MKKFFALILIMFVSFTSVAMAANKPARIARLPIIIQNNRLDYETAVTLEVRMSRVVTIPLNKTLKIAEFIPPKDSAKVLGGIWRKMYYQNRKSKLSDALKVLAEDINADLVICPILRQYSQYENNFGFNFETHISSAVSAEMIIYDRRTDNLIDKRVSRRYNDSYNKFGTASHLAGECFEQLIKDTQLRQILRSFKN